ncbi:MAG: glycosyltransferase [Bacteriovoracaceae bacterium]|nr:glycosyltransferase [Bacteriovoracaceae bacterium]
MKNETDTFTKVWIIFIAIVFLAVYYFSVDVNWETPEIARPVVQLMFYYLYLICIRSVIILGLSFWEYLFRQTLTSLDYDPIVTIIIPCYNEEAVIQDSINSVNEIDYPNLEVLVIDDGSKDDTFIKANEIAQKNDHVRVILKENGGKASALNFGIIEAMGDYIVCMDADSKLHPDVIKNALPYFKDNDNLAAVAGNVTVRGVKNILGLFQKLEYIIGLNFHKTAQSSLSAVTIVPGPIGVFKKNAVIGVGSYETDTFAEDADLTIKLLTAGWQIKYSPNVIAYTEVPDNLYELFVQRYRWSRGTIQAISKNVFKFNSTKFNWRSISVILYVAAETMIIPSINFIFAMLTIFFALQFDITNLYGPFFAGLTLMDGTLALYAIITEREVKSMIFLAIIGRITYGFMLEIIRFYSMVDEILNIPMKWGALTRKGMD